MIFGSGGELPSELRELYAEAARFTQRMSMPEASGALCSGRDGSGAVVVMAGPDGWITDIRLDPSWSQRVSVEALGGAVVDAVNEVTVARLGAWVDASDGEGGGTDAVVGTIRGLDRSPREHVPQVPPPGPIGDLSSPVIEAHVGELFELVAAARTAVNELRQRLEERSSAVTEGHSPGREVTVTLRGDQPVDVRITPGWARRASPRVIEQALRAAFAVAYQSRGRSSFEDLVSGSSIAELRRLTADPLALLRYVGLRPPAPSS